jgi:hypothetical protein
MQDLKNAYGQSVQLTQMQIQKLFSCGERWFYFENGTDYCFSSQKDKGKSAGKWGQLHRIINPFYTELKR